MGAFKARGMVREIQVHGQRERAEGVWEGGWGARRGAGLGSSGVGRGLPGFESSLGPPLSLSFPTRQRGMLVSSLLHAGSEDSPSPVLRLGSCSSGHRDSGCPLPPEATGDGFQTLVSSSDCPEGQGVSVIPEAPRPSGTLWLFPFAPP